MLLIDGKITKNFNIKEFRCKGNGEILLNQEVIEHIQRLQKFRDWYNRPMTINSGFRTVEYNRKVGGAKASQHLKGLATDIALPREFYSFNKTRQDEFLDHIKQKWFELCDENGVNGGVGIYKTFIHLDSRTTKRAFWDMRQ
ncbi:MAG: D-Ala-D-Ala carboxypeptidase family metallohydrolase [Tepidibacter sp.]|jgi:uncharacterized protein YcbK (DUF882 family)|uniref:D-Ala-D-Ala carboxypeptidase family metallohydrolase n=1 Tax=Tepidibacter sp. TaxID=2529387 RepID=UPI0025DBCBB0|nr:D-Ala-D-Ala carboxypeptidase family metallohydrolase [Tepidibacter sp.]MCT4507844.1 D-Ala-D-Ala carboxypeptidase family metallohydrolase [Tepidibacter sp.]